MARTKSNTQNDTKKHVEHHDATDTILFKGCPDFPLCDRATHTNNNNETRPYLLNDSDPTVFKCFLTFLSFYVQAEWRIFLSYTKQEPYPIYLFSRVLVDTNIFLKPTLCVVGRLRVWEFYLIHALLRANA